MQILLIYNFLRPQAKLIIDFDSLDGRYGNIDDTVGKIEEKQIKNFVIRFSINQLLLQQIILIIHS